MDYPYKTPLEYIQMDAFRHFPKAMASDLGIDDAHIYRARKGDFTPTFVKALREKGLIPPKETRCRIAADVTPAQRDRLHEIAAEKGLTWSQYCQRLADTL